MTDIPNEVLAERIEGVKEKIDQHVVMLKTIIIDATKDQNKSLARIEDQTTKTNGRVNRLEEWKNKNEMALQAMIAEREDQRRRMLDLIWKFGTVLLLGLLTIKAFTSLI